MKTYVIGRGTEAQIQLPASDVSRAHAELTVTDAGSYYIVDRASTGQTFLQAGGNWEAVGQSFVEKSDKVRFSTYETTVSDLLRLVGKVAASPAAPESGTEVPREPSTRETPEPPSRPRTSGPRPWRDPVTGEVIYKS